MEPVDADQRVGYLLANGFLERRGRIDCDDLDAVPPGLAALSEPAADRGGVAARRRCPEPGPQSALTMVDIHCSTRRQPPVSLRNQRTRRQRCSSIPTGGRTTRRCPAAA